MRRVQTFFLFSIGRCVNIGRPQHRVVPAAADRQRDFRVSVEVRYVVVALQRPEFVVLSSIVVVEENAFEVGNYGQRRVARFERSLKTPTPSSVPSLP